MKRAGLRARSGKAPRAASPRHVVRSQLLAFAVCLGFCLMSVRAAQLGLAGAGGRASTETAAQALQRGDLLDRNGLLLATSAPTYIVQVERARQWDRRETAQSLLRVLPMLDSATLDRRLKGDRGVITVARRLTPAQRDAVFALGLPGVTLLEEPARFYPRRWSGAHLIGQTDRALRGVAGLERVFDARLRQDGGPVTVSIDLRLQHALEAEIEVARRASGALYGAGVLLDGRTGEVLALASLPGFDANRQPDPAAPVRINRALGEGYEYGSVLKPFTVAMALDAGLTTPAEQFDLSPIQVGGRTIEDPHPLPGETGDLAAILAESSNVGAAALALRLGEARQTAGLRALGLVEGAPIAMAEAVAPWFSGTKDPYTVASRGFGHGLSVSLLALARAYTVFVNDGAMVSLRLTPPAEGEEIARSPVFGKSAAATVRGYLRGVVTQGTGRLADLAEVAVAGKTGTGEKFVAGRYDPRRNVASFAALFPAERPRYVLLTALDEPHTGTGGALAAPLTARIVARIAPLLDIAPQSAAAPASVP